VSVTVRATAGDRSNPRGVPPRREARRRGGTGQGGADLLCVLLSPRVSA